MTWLEDDADGAKLASLQAMLREWPFFATLLSNMDMVLSKTDLAVASRYAELVTDKTLRDSIFSTNSAYEIYRSSSSSATFSWTYSDYWNNGVGSVSNATCSSNCISQNPLYVAAGDFHLQATSPARQAGTSGSDLGALAYAPGAVNTIVVTPNAPSVAAGGTQTFTATAYDTANQPINGVVFTWSSTAAAGSINQSGVLSSPGFATVMLPAKDINTKIPLDGTVVDLDLPPMR
jgi:hypothetical protein